MALKVSAAGMACLPKYLDAGGRLSSDSGIRSSAQWGTVDVADRTIVPATAYTVTAGWRARPSARDPRRRVWGDADGRNGVDVFDIVCVMDGSQGLFTHCGREADEQKAGVPDGVIDLGDILATLDAFSGLPYPDADPCP